MAPAKSKGRKTAASSRSKAKTVKSEEEEDEGPIAEGSGSGGEAQEEEAEGEYALEEGPVGILDSVQGEIIFLKALSKHRPIGLERHFEMAALIRTINDALVTSALEGGQEGVEGPEVWDKIKSMWDIERLDGDVTPPFSSPSDTPPPSEEIDKKAFHLPFTGSFDALVDSRRLHSAASRSPPDLNAPQLPALEGNGSGSSLTGTDDEDEEMVDAEEELKEGGPVEEETEEDEEQTEEESEEEMTPVKNKRMKAKR